MLDYSLTIAVRHNNGFLKLWCGQTISEVGSRITREGLPLTAVLVLRATPKQMGVLAAAGSGSVLVFSVAAGVIADRVSRRPLMIGADLGRAVLLATIPAVAMTHQLSMTYLIAVAVCAGLLTVLFDVSYQSYLPSLVSQGELLEGNRLLSISSATAEILGPSLTGVLVQLISAPIAILIDALSFVISAVSVWWIRQPEIKIQPAARVSLREEAWEGMRTILAHRALRALLFRSVTAFLSMGFVFSFYILYAIQVLHFNPVKLGLSIALGGAGSLAGGVLAGRIARHLQAGRSFLASAVIMGLTGLCLPLASVWPRYALLLVCIQQCLGDCAWTVYIVNETTLRQTVAPAHLLGRVNAAMQLASRGMLPVGALAAGFLGSSIGITNTLWIGSAGVLLSTLWLAPFAGWKGDMVESGSQ